MLDHASSAEGVADEMVSRIRAAVKRCLPFLLPTQGVNLALLVRAILLKRTLCQTDLARTFPRPTKRQVPAPKHDLLHRVKRLSRFLENDQVDPRAVQVALLSDTLGCLGRLRQIGPCIDWTSFNGPTFRVQILKIGVARRGRVIPLLQVADERDDLPADRSQNQLEEEALAAVLAALPLGCRPVILADRGFARQEFFQGALARQLDFVVRIDKGTGVTDGTECRTKLGTEGTRRGEQRWLERVRYALYHARPTDIWLNGGISWQIGPPGAQRKSPAAPQEPWYLATTLPTIHAAVAWYRQRFWIEESFKDDKGRFLLDAVRVESTVRLNRLLMALTMAISWLSLIGLPKTHILPHNWNATVVTRGTASLLHQALVFLEDRWVLPQVFEAT